MSHRITTLPPPHFDERISYGGSPSQIIHVRLPRERGTRPLVIFLHGGFWRSQQDLLHTGHACAALTRAGFVTVNVEYRRVGEDGGGWPGTFHDTRYAVRFARVEAPKWGADPRRTIVIGHSAGGHLALLLAAEISDLKSVIALGPVASLRKAYELHLGNDAAQEFMHGSPEEKAEDYARADPALRPSKVQRHLIHSADDDIVPIEVSQEYVRARSGDAGGVTLETLPAGGHHDVIDPTTEAFESVLRAARSV